MNRIYEDYEQDDIQDFIENIMDQEDYCDNMSREYLPDPEEE